MASSSARRILFVDCSSILKRFAFFHHDGKPEHYAFDRFCNVLIESVLEMRPSLIFTVCSAPIDNLWRRELYPLYQNGFIGSYHHRIYEQNRPLLDELPERLETLSHIACPRQCNESGDLISSIIHQHTARDDQLFVMAAPKKFEQLLALNDDGRRDVQYVTTTKRATDGLDGALHFEFKYTTTNYLGVANHFVTDYLALCGIQSDSICGVKGIGPVRAKRLLEFGGVPFLLNNQQWKRESTKSLVAAIENQSEALRLFHDRLIPFRTNVDVTSGVENAKPLPPDYFDDGDAALRLRSAIQPLAEKYCLRQTSWQWRTLRTASSGHLQCQSSTKTAIDSCEAHRVGGQ